MLKKSKEYFTLNEASEANLNVDKRILKSAIFAYTSVYMVCKELLAAGAVFTCNQDLMDAFGGSLVCRS